MFNLYDACHYVSHPSPLLYKTMHFRRNYYLILIFSLIFHEVSLTDYCKICKKGLSHTLCRYKEGPADGCVEYKKPEISSSVKKYIVDIHNDIRNHVASGQETRGALGRQPSASNMNLLQWDTELAEIAQRWADQCIDLDVEIQHDQCRTTERFELGQNVLTAVTPTLDVPEIAILILNWYKQVEDVLPSDIETFSGIQRGKYLIGQYTQLIWADTRFVGCGMSTFRNRNLSDHKAKYLHRLVCNYGPRGNLIGSSVYNRGVSCSKCAYGRCDSVRTSLCQAIEQPFSKEFEKSSLPNIALNMPISLFDTISLGYILKNNLSDVINNILRKVAVRTSSHIDLSRNHKAPNLPDTLYLLSTLLAKINMAELDGELEKAQISKDMKNELKKTSNILYHDSIRHQTYKNLYELEAGKVIVDGCKNQLEQCQYEDETTNQPTSNEYIVLPNKMVYRKIEGIWFHGKCRCNYVYRSHSVLWKCSKIFIITLMMYFVIENI